MGTGYLGGIWRQRLSTQEDRKVKAWLQLKHGRDAEGNKKYLSSKENAGPWTKGTKKGQGIKRLLGWEGLPSDLPEGSGRVCASEA